MSKFEQLKSLVKKQVRKAFPLQFQKEMKHPTPTEENEGWYTVTVDYVTTKELKKLFKPLLEARGCVCDFRRLDCWAEMYLIIFERLNSNLSFKERKIKFVKETLAKNSIFKNKLDELAKKLGINLKFRRSLMNVSQGYLERFKVLNTGLEIGFACDRSDPEFTSKSYSEKIGKYYGTFALFNQGVMVADFLTLESLEKQLETVTS